MKDVDGSLVVLSMNRASKSSVEDLIAFNERDLLEQIENLCPRLVEAVNGAVGLTSSQEKE